MHRHLTFLAAASAAAATAAAAASSPCSTSTSQTAFAFRIHSRIAAINNNINSRRRKYACFLEEGCGSGTLTTTSQADDITVFEQQLAICHQIILDHDEAFNNNTTNDIRVRQKYDSNDQQSMQNNQRKRRRFKEHPRCTARFGEVLLHTRDSATSSNDEQYQQAIHNSRSIVEYIHTCRSKTDDASSLPIRKDLIADIVAALTSPSLQRFRARQITEDVVWSRKEDTAQTTSDFTLEQADLEILGRLYYSAIRWSEQYLREIGLTSDHGGFTVLLALCRAASDSCTIELPNLASTPSSNVASFMSVNMLSEYGAKLDAAISNHFNGIVSPGCRFSFSRRHGLNSSLEYPIRTRSKHLIVAFSSLGNGLVRHEFLGSLAQVNNRLHAEADGEGTRNTGDDVFDVLFVADPGQSWYQKDSYGKFNGFAEYEKRIRAASRPYDRVSLIGDSMGGSGALLFSHLATDESAVVAFSPQIDLVADEHHVSRYDLSTSVRNTFCNRLLRSVMEAVLAKKTNIFIHRGVYPADVHHTNRLLKDCTSWRVATDKSVNRVKVIEHADCRHHQVAVHLKERGQLTNVLYRNLIVGACL